MNPPEQRTSPEDRRSHPTRFLNPYFLWGRRYGARRVAEQVPGYVDRPSNIWIMAAVVLVLCGAADAMLTHYGIYTRVAAEANPFMRNLLQMLGPRQAWSLKVLITVFGAWVLLSHHRWHTGRLGLLFVVVYYIFILLLHAVGLVSVLIG